MYRRQLVWASVHGLVSCHYTHSTSEFAYTTLRPAGYVSVSLLLSLFSFISFVFFSAYLIVYGSLWLCSSSHAHFMFKFHVCSPLYRLASVYLVKYGASIRIADSTRKKKVNSNTKFIYRQTYTQAEHTHTRARRHIGFDTDCWLLSTRCELLFVAVSVHNSV